MGKMVRGDRGELRSRERKAPRRRDGEKGEADEKGEEAEGESEHRGEGERLRVHLPRRHHRQQRTQQFLIVNDKAIIAFITKRKKFTACESFTDITTSVSCKSVSGLDNITLPSSSSTSSSNSTGTATTA